MVDLLETRHISWGEYQEHLPHAGFRGMNFSSGHGQSRLTPDYVRKHNPLVLFDSVALNETRLANIKNFTGFYEDLTEKKLPQWGFVTPNMVCLPFSPFSSLLSFPLAYPAFP